MTRIRGGAMTRSHDSDPRWRIRVYGPSRRGCSLPCCPYPAAPPGPRHVNQTRACSASESSESFRVASSDRRASPGARVRVGGEAERRHFDDPSRFPQRRRRTTQSSLHLTRRRRSGPRATPSQGAQPAGRLFVRVCGAKVLRDSDGTEGCRGPGPVAKAAVV